MKSKPKSEYQDADIVEFSDAEERDAEAPKKKKKSGGFQSMDLIPTLFRGIIKKGFRVPTPIQRKTIPLLLQGLDVVAMARTGSGKTAAFVIPMIQRLREHSQKVGVRAIIVSPTRDLAVQTFTVVQELAKFTDLRICLLVGGAGMEKQFEELSRNPDILIVTPGRLVHHMIEVEVSLQSVEYLVFDEADRLFEMGFADQVNEIMRQVSPSRQTCLFSATMPKLLVEFARAGLQDPQVVRLDTDTKISEQLEIAFFTIRPSEKVAALLYILRNLVKPQQQTIVFACTRHHVEFLHILLRCMSIPSSIVYGSMNQEMRSTNLYDFRTRRTMLLIVTDVAARGIDIPLLDNVINFDFPTTPKLFVHRVGRVARQGRPGRAFNLATQEEYPFMVELYLFLPRSLQNTPKEGRPITTQDVFYGNMPQLEIDRLAEETRTIIEHNTDLVGLERSMSNAWKLYLKTRTSASGQSVRRAKELDTSKIHPMLCSHIKSEDIVAADYIHKLKTFRPSLTIMEMEHKLKAVANSAMPEVMRAKRKMHNWAISMRKRDKAVDPMLGGAGDDDDNNGSTTAAAAAVAGPAEDDEAPKTKRSKKSAPTPVVPTAPVPQIADTASRKRKHATTEAAERKKPTSFRDDAFFIPYEAPDRAAEKAMSISDNAAVFDVIPDDNKDLQRHQTARKFDMRKKKYVEMRVGSDGKMLHKAKNDAGAKIKAPYKTGRYEKWQEQTHSRVQRGGEQEDKSAMQRRPQQQRDIPNAGAREELRDKTTLRKNLRDDMKKKDRQERQKGVQNKEKYGTASGKQLQLKRGSAKSRAQASVKRAQQKHRTMNNSQSRRR
eukprot:TRINITY_DN9084_c0_g1_i1.p1 TRINITY_DN9084_c0_g1~~TRINITY_DN9084_c0_g1_i1.p1  ORF type:complete len:840 (+),score=236.49 TRINITY_DN9084_c0_g1_i1:26-2521(+)